MKETEDLRYYEEIFILYLIPLQVLEYDGSTWTEKKETMTTARYSHAIVEVNLPTLCSATGNLNPI